MHGNPPRPLLKNINYLLWFDPWSFPIYSSYCFGGEIHFTTIFLLFRSKFEWQRQQTDFILYVGRNENEKSHVIRNYHNFYFYNHNAMYPLCNHLLTTWGHEMKGDRVITNILWAVNLSSHEPSQINKKYFISQLFTS